MAYDSGTRATDVMVFPNGATPSRSPILTSSGEEMFSQAIALTLKAPPDRRADLFEQLLQDIIATVSANPEMRPWQYTVHAGTDGSRVFRGGIGLCLVIDPNGRLWRARTYEDFETTYTITITSCEIASMRPKYEQMREYLPD